MQSRSGAIATNSLLLFGRRLWHETRIALFQQSVDTRASSHHMREVSPRVDFGRQWVKSSVAELFQEAIARYRVLIAGETDEDPVAKVEQGIAPNLRALRLHNGTIYRWNRACYGISENGKPHLRIENRILPSGPTPIDEMANAAFWYGLMLGLGNQVDDVTKHISFDDAKGNFFGAARQGLGAQITWIDGHAYQARDLLREKLLPLAWDGLRSAKIDTADIEKYLTVIQHRVETAQTGSRWALKSFAALNAHGTPGERLNAITAGAVAREQKNIPVSRWELAQIEEGGGWKNNYTKVEQFMSTDFVTVHPTDGLDFVANLMVWEKIRHVCVEDAEHRLVGLVSYRSLLRMLALGAASGKAVNETPVSEVMKLHPVCVTPETPTLHAIEMMARCDYGVLPVLNDGRLVGMIMARNFMHIAAELLAQKLKE